MAEWGAGRATLRGLARALGATHPMLRLQQPPRLAILLVLIHFPPPPIGMEIETIALAERSDRDDVPDVLGHQIDHKHIDLIRGVHFVTAISVAASAYAVAPVAGFVHGLHLHSPHPAS